MREKYWSEINDTEKIERLRKEIKYLKNRISDISSQSYKLEQHEHNALGKIVVPINSGGSPTGMVTPIGKNKDDVYI